jgi:uncharacterized membrane protein YgcG
MLGGGFVVSPASADVNDFTFSSMHATYLLGVNETGHSTLTTIEKLVAEFPDVDQNHGIQRAIPLDFNGHGTDLRLESVENAEGTPLPYTAEESSGFLVVTIASDEFVHGEHTYVLTYTQDDVTLTPTNGGGNQEFYWDVNGTGWAQPFDSVVAVVLMPGWLASALTGSASCYQGAQSSTVPCTSIERAALGATAQFTATATALAPGENLTLAIGFVPGTFVERNTSFFGSPLAIPLLCLVVLGLAILATTLSLRATRWRDHPGRGIIVAEYGPPPGITPLLAVNVYGRSTRAIAAAIVGLAVSGNILILDESSTNRPLARDRRLWGSRAEPDFTLELVSIVDVSPEELQLLEALFGSTLEVGSQRALNVVDAGLTRRLARLRSFATRAMRTAGMRESIGTTLPLILSSVSVLAAASTAFLAISMAAQDCGGSVPFLLTMLTIVVAVLTIVFCVNVHPLTAQGAGLKDHLRGLREFIVIAEADRLRVLQSPTGALRTPVDVNDVRLRLTLTEKVLPYAVLFGLEKEWAPVLANIYAETNAQPTWYSGGAGFNAVLFAGTISSFTSAAAGAWAASASSSSFGGSTGGGFSGGGGGGGGGGGV